MTASEQTEIHAGRRARTIGFEELATDVRIEIPKGYGGFRWDHIELANAVTRPISEDAIASGTQAAINQWAQGSGFGLTRGSFDLVGLSLGGAFEAFNVVIYGYIDGEIVHTARVHVTTARSKDVDLDWQGIDQVTFKVRPDNFFLLDDVKVANVVRADADTGAKLLHSDVFGDDTAVIGGALPIGPLHGDTLHVTHLV